MLPDRDIKSINLWISLMKHYQNMDRRQKVKSAASILQLKYKVIGYGNHRIVYALNNKYVLKVAVTHQGIVSNDTESKIYTNCPSALQKHLCPVKSYGGSWIIMKRLVPKIPMNKLYKKKLSELTNKFQNHGIIPKDLKSSNLALSENDEIIVIDYGHFNLN